MRDETIGEAEFNMGADYLSRLNILLYWLNEAQRLEDIKNTRLMLDRVYAEIRPMMSPADKENHKTYRNMVIKSYNKYALYVKNYNQTRSKYAAFMPPIDVRNNMFEWELELREIIKKTGMLIPMKDKRLAAARGEYG